MRSRRNDECRGTRVPRANRVEPARTVHSFGDEDNGPRESSRRTKNTGRGSEIKVELDASDFDVGFGLGQGKQKPRGLSQQAGDAQGIRFTHIPTVVNGAPTHLVTPSTTELVCASDIPQLDGDRTPPPTSRWIVLTVPAQVRFHFLTRLVTSILHFDDRPGTQFHSNGI